MKKYFCLQLKRVVKIFPFVLAVTMALLVGLVMVLYGILSMFNDREENKRFTIALAGDTDNEYINWGIAAMQTFDETRFSIEFVEMTETEAQEALAKRKIAAYVVLPEDFIEKAISGDMEPITYVTSAGMEGVVSLFKKEITSLVTDMVVYSQKGAYGLGDALNDNGLGESSYARMNEISLEYADLIFHRNELYSVDEIGISDGLSITEYYICAIAVMLLVLIGMPFAAIYIKKDYAFNRLVLSRGYSSGVQLACEYAVHFITMLLLAEVILIVIFAGISIMPETVSSIFSTQTWTSFVIKIIPVVITIAAFNIMMFEFSNNLVSGLLLHFFTAICLCYISGCMYPIFAFPQIIKSISTFLPTGMARSYLATCFTFDTSVYDLVGLILYAVVFYSVALFLRFRKTKGIQG